MTAVDIDPDRLAETVVLAGAAGDRITVQPADLRTPEACAGVVASALARHGRLDVLGNVAGVSWAQHVTDVSIEEYRTMMALNVDAYFFLAQQAIPHLLTAGGCVVNIASNAGLMGQAYTVVYSMTKGAVVQLTKSLAMEYLKTPLRVNAIAPGHVNTSMTASFRMPPDIDWDLLSRYVSPRPGSDPDEIANLFAYLASDEARSIHGAILSIDNGLTAG